MPQCIYLIPTLLSAWDLLSNNTRVFITQQPSHALHAIARACHLPIIEIGGESDMAHYVIGIRPDMRHVYARAVVETLLYLNWHDAILVFDNLTGKWQVIFPTL